MGQIQISPGGSPVPASTEPVPDDPARRLRSLQNRAAIATRWSRLPAGERTKQTQPARDGILARLANQIDPDGKLDPAERAKLAEEARRAHLLTIAAKGVSARAANREARARFARAVVAAAKLAAAPEPDIEFAPEPALSLPEPAEPRPVGRLPLCPGCRQRIDSHDPKTGQCPQP
jgi:hypothetical protein